MKPCFTFLAVWEGWRWGFSLSGFIICEREDKEGEHFSDDS